MNKQQLIYWYMLIKTWIAVKLSYFKRIFIDTVNIKSLDHRTVKSQHIRYLVLKFLFYCKKMLEILINFIDITPDKIQFTKDYNGTHSNYIVKGLSMYDAIKYIDNNGYVDDIIGRIFIKINLVDGQKSYCLKNNILKYKDSEELFDNTLGNIIAFDENIPGPISSSARIIMTFFENRKKYDLDISYDECKTKHINYLNRINY